MVELVNDSASQFASMCVRLDAGAQGKNSSRDASSLSCGQFWRFMWMHFSNKSRSMHSLLLYRTLLTCNVLVYCCSARHCVVVTLLNLAVGRWGDSDVVTMDADDAKLCYASPLHSITIIPPRWACPTSAQISHG